MIIKTLKDAEFAINALQRELAQVTSRAQQSGVSLEEVKTLIKRAQNVQVVRQEVVTNASQFDLTDIDATPSEGQIIHRLVHLFYQDVRFAKSIRLADGWFYTENGFQQWKVNVGFDNPYGGSDPNLQMRWLDSVTPANNKGFYLDPAGFMFWDGSIVPGADNLHDLGNSSLNWRNLRLRGDVFQASEASAKNVYSTHYGNTPANANLFWMRRARGTIATPLDVQIGDRLGFFPVFQGYRNGAFRNSNYFETYVTGLPGINPVCSEIAWVTTNTAGVTGARWKFVADGHIVPVVDNTQDLGSATERVRKLWAVDIDFSGTLTGALPATDANTQLNANASASLTLTTSFTDVSGVSVSLNKNGTWLIICTVVGSKELNDDEIQGQLVYDSVAQSGIIRMAASSANFLRTTGTRSWVVSVTGQPKTAKLQCKKNAGTGTSTVDITNCNIMAVFLTT